MTHRQARLKRCRPWAVLAVLALGAVSGCGPTNNQQVNFFARGYDGVAVGRTVAPELPALLPPDAIRTAGGMAWYGKTDWNSAEEATVVLLDPAGVTRAKFRVVVRKESYGFAEKRVAEVQGEFVGRIAPTVPPGDFAQITAAIEELRKPQTNQVARDAHNLVSAGLLRVLEHLPGVPVPAGEVQRQSANLAKMPAGGEITLSVIRPAGYKVTYNVQQVTNP